MATPGRETINLNGLSPEQQREALQRAYDGGRRNMLYIHDSNPRVVARPGNPAWAPIANKSRYSGPEFANGFLTQNKYPGAVPIPAPGAAPQAEPLAVSQQQPPTPKPNFIEHTRQILSRQPQAAPPGAASVDANGMMRIATPGGVKFSVGKDYAPRFEGFLGALEKAGYPIQQGQSGGYNYRNIAGTNKLSRHATGEAIDVNWNENPRSRSNAYGKIGEIVGADKVRQMAGQYGLKWGGDWKHPDAMHFEIDRDWNGSLPGKGTPPPTIMQGQPQERDPGYTQNTRSIQQPSSITPGAMSMPQTNTIVMSDKDSGGSLTLPNFRYPGDPEAGWMTEAPYNKQAAGASGEKVLNPASGMMDNRLATAAPPGASPQQPQIGQGWRDQPPRPAPGASPSPVAQPQPQQKNGAQWVNGTYGTGIQWGNGDTSFTQGGGQFKAGVLTDKPAPPPQSFQGLPSTLGAPGANAPKPVNFGSMFKGLFGG